MGAVVTTMGSAQMKTEQTLDAHGNVTQSKVYDYGNLVTPARTYNHTYYSFPAAFIFNRLLTSTVTPAGGSAMTLVANTYDYGGACGGFGISTPSPIYEWDSSGFFGRGNLIYQVTPNGATCFSGDTTGTVTMVTDPLGHYLSTTTSAATNYAAPSAMTPNSIGNLSTSMTYTSFLGIASVTGPNGGGFAVCLRLRRAPEGDHLAPWPKDRIRLHHFAAHHDRHHYDDRRH